MESRGTLVVGTDGDARPGHYSRARASWSAAPFIGPAAVLVAVLLLVPFVATFIQSFQSRTGARNGFVGLYNYGVMFSDPMFVRSLLNTLMWTVGTLILPVGIGLLVAVFTNSISWGKWVRWVFVLPYALSGTATAVVWGFLLRSDGALNQAITFFGGHAPQSGWLLQWPTNTIIMIIANTWQATGVAVILFLVGLQSIPPDTLEAGMLDGATGMSLFGYVVFPQLQAITTVVIGISITNSLRVFDMIWLLTKGGPGAVSETLAVTMYRKTFILNDYGYGSAVAVVLAVIVFAASYAYLRQQVRR